MNLHVPQSTQAQTECRTILHIKNNAVNGGMNCAVFGAVQDTMCGLNLMTRADAMVPIELLMDCAMHHRYNYRDLHEIMPPHDPDGKRPSLVPAWWALDLLFPRDFCYTCDGVLIVDGRIQPGSAPFTSKHAGSGSTSINYVLAIDYGMDKSVEWLSDAGRTAYVFITQWQGFSVSLSDMHTPGNVARDAQERIRNACSAAELRNTDREQMESLSGAMQAATEALDRTSFANPQNALHTMIVSGAKGSRLNAQQLMIAVGQQVIGSGRPPLDGNGRTLSCFRPGGLDSRNTQSRGMICQSYCHALGPVENYFHSAAARKGLAETVRDCAVAQLATLHCVCVFCVCCPRILVPAKSGATVAQLRNIMCACLCVFVRGCLCVFVCACLFVRVCACAPNAVVRYQQDGLLAAQVGKDARGRHCAVRRHCAEQPESHSRIALLGRHVSDLSGKVYSKTLACAQPRPGCRSASVSHRANSHNADTAPRRRSACTVQHGALLGPVHFQGRAAKRSFCRAGQLGR